MKLTYHLLLVLLVSAFTANAEEVTAQEDDQMEWAEAQQYKIPAIAPLKITKVAWPVKGNQSPMERRSNYLGG